MDDQDNTQAITDDQELAKALAGVSKQADDAASSGAGTTFDADTPATDDAAEPTEAAAETADADAAPESPAVSPADEMKLPEPVEAEAPADEAPTIVPDLTAPAAGSDDLDSIKQEALGELRPLVDKLNVAPEEKFDTYLLLLRSTDDRELIAPAHDAAREIPDEARRAQALLDIIKEIDFLSQNAAQ